MGAYQDTLSTIGKQADDEIAAAATKNAALLAQNSDLEEQNAALMKENAALKAQIPKKYRLGMYVYGGETGYKNCETWLGREVDLVHVFTAAKNNPPSVDAARKDNMLLSVDMLNGFTFDQVIAGEADNVWKAFGTRLVAAGMANAILRIGWEYNGTWFAWSLNKTTPAKWKATYRRIVTVLRGVTGQKFTFEWNLAQGKAIDYASYPGDDVVDFWGCDTYAGWGGPANEGKTVYTNTPESRTKWLDPWLAEAAKHSKQVCFSEWGLWEKDSADYVKEMFDRFDALGAKLAYHVYFNVNGTDKIEHRIPAPYSSGGAVFKARIPR